jgi:hypothetical protein
MVYNKITGFLVFVHRTELYITRKLNVSETPFASAGEGRETSTLFDPMNEVSPL